MWQGSRHTPFANQTVGPRPSIRASEHASYRVRFVIGATTIHSVDTVVASLFSFATPTTVSYGDITLLHPLARSVVAMTGLIGQLDPAILVARPVTLYRRAP